MLLSKRTVIALALSACCPLRGCQWLRCRRSNVSWEVCLLRSPAEHCCPVVKDRADVMSENNPLPEVAISLATMVSSSIGCS